ncbi:hypothetical protein RJ640_002948 [Escallonia rubra]|uniref:F-box domain-containing protein n=1 Tax=Escallonia rubra TaxID=112253 RepID=A0AA88UTT7_9ASTE|nr:hypothetical protein RJ640_002948 [Escallonia rubra]
MEATAAQNPNWLELPPEVTASILRRLGAVELLETARKVCTTWRNICKDPAMWRTVDIRKSRETNLRQHDLEEITMSALKRLQLAYCYGNISPETFREVFKKLPLLEELHLYFTVFDKEDIEVAGRFCTLLKSFKLNRQAHKHPGKCDDEALAIAESMPELRHLQLFGSTMTDDGLGAILDKCPHLESLDLRQCFNVSLAGDVGKICFERIKDLKRPHDSTDGCGFYTLLVDSDSDDDYDYGIDYDEQVYGYDDDHPDMSDYYYGKPNLHQSPTANTHPELKIFFSLSGLFHALPRKRILFQLCSSKSVKSGGPVLAVDLVVAIPAFGEEGVDGLRRSEKRRVVAALSKGMAGDAVEWLFEVYDGAGSW